MTQSTDAHRQRTRNNPARGRNAVPGLPRQGLGLISSGLVVCGMYVDFGAIPESHSAMHARLENWGRACYSRPGSTTAPVFRLFVPAKHWAPYGSATADPVDQEDARKVGEGVYRLPEPHRLSLHWCYVQRASVTAGKRLLACSAESLARYVSDARSMLINRGV